MGRYFLNSFHCITLFILLDTKLIGLFVGIERHQRIIIAGQRGFGVNPPAGKIALQDSIVNIPFGLPGSAQCLSFRSFDCLFNFIFGFLKFVLITLGINIVGGERFGRSLGEL